MSTPLTKKRLRLPLSVALTTVCVVALWSQSRQQADLCDQLCAASRRGDVILVEGLLNRGVSVNCQGGPPVTEYETDNPKWSIRRPPLTWAAMAGELKVVELLVQRGSDRRALDQNGHDAALLAAGPQREQILHVLHR
jgi:hypothetical protein